LGALVSGGETLIEVNPTGIWQNFGQACDSRHGPLTGAEFRARDCICIAAAQTSVKAIFEERLASKSGTILPDSLKVVLPLHREAGLAPHMDIEIAYMEAFFVAMPISMRECRVRVESSKHLALNMAFVGQERPS